MLRLIFCFLVITFHANSNENLLTIKQQIERLQREVSDLSQTIYSDRNIKSNNGENDLVTNLSAIDMRIYDLEKDVKKLTGSLEDIYFQIEDLLLQFKNYENIFLDKKNNNLSIQNNELIEEKKNSDENTLGSLKITSTNSTKLEIGDENSIKNNSEKIEQELSPEEQFQIAFDNIRNKKWEDAKNLFIIFIENNNDNQLSGSAHYWLGELYILDRQYRDAALVLAEGYQKFPESIKAPDMLFKLSQSLYSVQKIEESCKTLEKLILDFPKNKIINNANKLFQNYGCLENNQ